MRVGFEGELLHYSLPFPRAEEVVLVLATNGILSQIACEKGAPKMVVQEQFTDAETRVLLPLLDMFPDYCPYEVIYASFYKGNTTEGTVERCRRRLQTAQEEGQWDADFRAVRGALSRTRLKLRPFGIEIVALLSMGYVLRLLSVPRDGDGGYRETGPMRRADIWEGLRERARE